MIYEVMDSYMSHKIKANVQNKPSFSLDSFCKQELCEDAVYKKLQNGSGSIG